MTELTESQLYDLGRHGVEGIGFKQFNYVFIHHLRHDHNLPIHLIAKRMDLKMNTVKKYLNARVDKQGKIRLDD